VGVLKRRGRLALGLLAGLALMLVFFKGLEWGALGRAFRTAHLGFLVGVALITIVTYAARAWRWGYLLAPLARVPFARLFSITLIGFMSGLAIPRAGEILRPYLVGRHHGIQVSAAFASIILERLLDLMMVIFLFFLYLYLLPLPPSQQGGAVLAACKHAGILTGLLALAILAFLIIFHIYAERAMTVIDRWLAHLPRRLAQPLSHALRAFGAGLAVLKAPAPHLLAIVGQTVLVWMTIALSFYFTNRAFGIALPFHATFLMMAFLVVGVAIPTPGMVGGFHEFFLLSLQNFGVDKATAVAAGITCHALTNLPVLILGLFYMGREGLTMAKVAEMAEEQSGARGADGPSARPAS
jgi:glycosyltransferase 2 family protein